MAGAFNEYNHVLAETQDGAPAAVVVANPNTQPIPVAGSVTLENSAVQVYGTVPLPTGASTETTLQSVLSVLNTMLTTLRNLPSGGGSYSADSVMNETPGGTVDGMNREFTTVAVFQPFRTQLYVNGVRQAEGSGNDYLENQDHQSFTMTQAPLVGDVLVIDYIKA